MTSLLNLIRLTLLLLLLSPLLIFSRKRFLYHFFYYGGPSFIKLGQLLSTRKDLVGEEMANILSQFQDRVKPFSKKKVKKILIKEYGQNYLDLFQEFNFEPVASASIAQVHKAKTKDGNDVAVKIVRPYIRRTIKRDIKTLSLLSKISKLIAKNFAKFCQDMLELLQETAKSELDLTKEAVNCSQLKENLQDVKGFYIPKVFWSMTNRNILVTQWLNGIAFSDKNAILQSEFDKNIIAQNLVIAYFNQVYKYGFFHGDMHPGNLFLLENGDIAAVDFGIMGIIDNKTRIAIANIVIGFINKDYIRVAQLHVDNDLVPANTNVKKLALSCRKIGETVVDSKVKDIPLAQLLQNLIEMTQEYKMSTKPELLLLQKAMLLIEGVGTMLNPELNIWDHAKPWIKDWSKTNIGFDAQIVDAVAEFLTKLKQILTPAK